MTLVERILKQIATKKKSGTMSIPGSEGKARKDVARAGFRKRGPVEEPKVTKSGDDVPVWVRSHKTPRDYAAHTAKQKHKEGEKTNVKALRKQLHQTGAKKDTEVHDITVGSPKSKIKDPGQRARAFVRGLKNVAGEVKSRKGIATNTPTAISSSGKKRKRSDEEGAEQRGRIYKKLGMGERNPKTGVQMAKIREGRLSFVDFLLIAEGNPTARMMQKSKTQVTGHISADRGTDEKKNRESRKSLEKGLTKHGIGYKKGVGEYKYSSGEGTGREVSYQTSKPEKMSKRRFGKIMRRLGRKHGQESVITKDKEKQARLHYTEKGSKMKSDSIGGSQPGKHPEGYGETSGTRVRSGKLPKKTNKPAYHYG